MKQAKSVGLDRQSWRVLGGEIPSRREKGKDEEGRKPGVT